MKNESMVKNFLYIYMKSIVEKNPKELSKHARLLGTSEYVGIVFF